jgi:hypothetical protein
MNRVNFRHAVNTSCRLDKKVPFFDSLKSTLFISGDKIALVNKKRTQHAKN